MLIFDIPPASFVMHICDLVNLLQGRLFAFRANCEWVIGVMLENLVLLSAVVTMVNV